MKASAPKQKNRSTLYGDLLWGAVLCSLVLFLIIPSSRAAFETITSNYVYPSSFVKFALLASMGELLGIRLGTGRWSIPAAMPLRVLIWGVVGMGVALVFAVYGGGVAAAQGKALLPGQGHVLITAFFISVFMNATFGPMLFAVHKFSDIALDLAFRDKEKVTMTKIVERTDWQTLVKTTWLKYCTFFWIPAHTLVFLLPPAYRIIASAFLSIALGIIASLSKRVVK